MVGLNICILAYILSLVRSSNHPIPIGIFSNMFLCRKRSQLYRRRLLIDKMYFTPLCASTSLYLTGRISFISRLSIPKDPSYRLIHSPRVSLKNPKTKIPQRNHRTSHHMAHHRLHQPPQQPQRPSRHPNPLRQPRPPHNRHNLQSPPLFRKNDLQTRPFPSISRRGSPHRKNYSGSTRPETENEVSSSLRRLSRT